MMLKNFYKAKFNIFKGSLFKDIKIEYDDVDELKVKLEKLFNEKKKTIDEEK